MTDPSAFDPTGPVFISYRHSDGKQIADELAWLLRAAGVPVWHDKDDLPPGDVVLRLERALESGLSGAVLVVTPETAKSESILNTEVPRIVDLHSAHPEFALSITHDYQTDEGAIDCHAPDRILAIPGASLNRILQHRTGREGLLELVRNMVRHRTTQAMEAITTPDDDVFTLSVQTRNTPRSDDRTGSVLDIRVRPSTHERLPSAAGLQDLADVIGHLPEMVSRSGKKHVRITGSAQLSVALAIGAALPSTRVGHMEVVDHRGPVGRSDGEARMPEEPRLSVTGSGGAKTLPPGRRVVAVYLDLLPGESSASFEQFIRNHGNGFTAWQHLTRVKPDGYIDIDETGIIAAESAYRIRELSNQNGNAEVHLMLRGTFGIAPLIGRLTNTLRLVAYEWDGGESDESDHEETSTDPRYVPAMQLRASAPQGAIRKVLLTDPE